MQFGSLITFAINVFEKREREFFADFKTHVITTFTLESTVRQATSYRDVFEQIGQEKHWDHTNYFPLIEILEHFIGEEVTDRCKDYQHAFTAYHHAAQRISHTLRKTDLRELKSQDAPLDLSISEIEMKLYPHRVTDRTMTYINSVWDSLADFFQLPAVETVVERMPSVDSEVDCFRATLPPKSTREPKIHCTSALRNFMEKEDVKEMSINSHNSQHVFTR